MTDEMIARFAAATDGGAVIAGGSSSKADQIAGAEAVFGGREISGRLKGNIAGVARKGDGVHIDKVRLGYAMAANDSREAEMAAKIDSIVEASIKAKAFPGCQVVVVRDGTVVFDEAYGTLDYSVGSRRVDRSTLYDVASMTKATATLSGLMAAYDDGLYKIDHPASEYLPRLRTTDKDQLTVREFLYHTTGIPAVVNTYNLMADTASYSGKLIQYKKSGPYTVKIEKGVYGHNGARLRPDLFSTERSKEFNIQIAPGLFGGQDMVKTMSDAIYNRKRGQKKYLYSCLNFCILKDMEEALTGVLHDRWVTDRVFGPLGATSTFYRPSDKGIDMNNIAPTEKDNFMRKSLMKGYVHDEMASYLGGVSGNAGLFSTAGDIAKLCQTWLDGGVYGGERIFKESTVKLFTTDVSKAINRGLGFDKPWRISSLRDTGIPASAYGHTGFTGTCFWVDPDNRVAVIILTNRVNPSRDNPAFDRLNPRRAILKAVYDTLIKDDEAEDTSDGDLSTQQ